MRDFKALFYGSLFWCEKIYSILHTTQQISTSQNFTPWKCRLEWLMERDWACAKPALGWVSDGPELGDILCYSTKGPEIIDPKKLLQVLVVYVVLISQRWNEKKYYVLISKCDFLY